MSTVQQMTPDAAKIKCDQRERSTRGGCEKCSSFSSVFDRWSSRTGDFHHENTKRTEFLTTRPHPHSEKEPPLSPRVGNPWAFYRVCASCLVLAEGKPSPSISSAATMSSSTSLNDLPNEMLESIFMYCGLESLETIKMLRELENCHILAVTRWPELQDSALQALEPAGDHSWNFEAVGPSRHNERNKDRSPSWKQHWSRWNAWGTCWRVGRAGICWDQQIRVYKQISTVAPAAFQNKVVKLSRSN